MIRDIVFSVIVGAFFGITAMQVYKTSINITSGIGAFLICLGLLRLLAYIGNGPLFSY